MRILIVLLFPFCLSAQNITSHNAFKELTLLKEEIKKYNKAVVQYHPEFEDKFKEIISNDIADTMSKFEYFQVVSKICAASGEGHFEIGNWTDDVHAGFLKNEYDFLPLSIKIIEDEIYVWSDFSNEKLLNRGDLIKEINGEFSSTVLKKLKNLMPSDGEVQYYSRRKIEQGFNWLYYLLIDQPEQFEIVVYTTKGELDTVTIQALNRDAHFENFKEYYGESSSSNKKEFYDLKLEKTTATLTLPTFSRTAAEQAGVEAKKLYKQIFKELHQKQVQNLIIDLRGNQGGLNEFADEMVKYIRDEETDVPFLKKSISWKGKRKNYKVPKRSKWAFSGRIYVLVDGLTFSNGSVLARYLREFAGAVIIGEETGSRYEGFAAGSTQYHTLSNTGWVIGIPRYHIYFPRSNKQSTYNRGVLPTYIIEYSIDDLIEGKDLHMEKALALIQE